MTCCCCDNPRDDESTGEEGECCITKDGRVCICLPYNDGYMIAAQVVSIAAFCISWVWWPVFIISAIPMILLQVLWCCRQSQTVLFASAILSAILAILCFFSGIWIILKWKNAYDCTPFVWDTYYRYGYDYDSTWCKYRYWSALLFVDCALWLATTKLVLDFVWSGRYEKWEKKLKSNKHAESSEVPEDPLPIPLLPDDDVTGNVKGREVAIPIATSNIELDPVEMNDSKETQSSSV